MFQQTVEKQQSQSQLAAKRNTVEKPLNADADFVDKRGEFQRLSQLQTRINVAMRRRK
jgi:hypothetical protein